MEATSENITVGQLFLFHCACA